MEESALFKDENETIRSNFHFEGLVTFAHHLSIADGKTIDGNDLSLLSEEHERFRQFIEEQMTNLTNDHRQLCYTIDDLQHVLESLYSDCSSLKKYSRKFGFALSLPVYFLGNLESC